MYKLLFIITRWDVMHTTMADFQSLSEAEAAFTAVEEQSKKFSRTHIEPVRLYDLEAQQAVLDYSPEEF